MATYGAHKYCLQVEGDKLWGEEFGKAQARDSLELTP